MKILGLRRESWSCLANNRAIFNADSTPFYIVFHGPSKFAHDHFGIHLGQEDHLTFLGSSDKRFIGHFIDCRKDSSTYRVRETIEFGCSPKVALVIPAGVAHAFEGIENVFTINNYKLYLPNRKKLFVGGGDWNINHDVINLPLDCPDKEIPGFFPNTEQAGDLLYELLAAHHRGTLAGRDISYPIVQEVATSDQGNVKIKFVPKRKAEHIRKLDREWESVLPLIPAKFLRKHLRVMSGDESGIIVVPSFSDLLILVSPYAALRSLIPADGLTIVATFLSVDNIHIDLRLRDRDIVKICVPGNGLFELVLPPEADVKVTAENVFIVVRVEK